MKKKYSKDWYDHINDIMDDADYNTSTWNPVSVVLLIMLLIVTITVIIWQIN